MGEKTNTEINRFSESGIGVIDRMKTVSVVIPVQNGAATLDRCLRSVKAAESPALEIIVVDDASGDGSGDIARTHDCRVFRNEQPMGAAFSRNRGAREAKGHILFFTDSDIEVPPDCFNGMIDFMTREGTDAAIGILDEQTEIPNFASRYENYYMHRQYVIHDPRIAIFYTSAAAIEKVLFEQVGGFDECYTGASIEDMEMGQRLVSAGHTLLINKAVRVRHLKRFTICSLLRVNCRKAEGTLKIKLRNMVRKVNTPRLVAPPAGFVAGIPLTGLGFAVLLLGGVTGLVWLMVLGVAAFGGVWGLNAGWLRYLYRREGSGFVVVSAVFLLLNYLVYAWGIGRGVWTFILGRRY
jgi:glycosyltransferase involved in cell wall biosynthesis